MIQSDNIVIIDCQLAGISGDMFLGALLDLGADIDKIITGIKSLEEQFKGYKNVDVKIRDVTRRELKVKKIDVTAKNTCKLKAKEVLNGVDRCVSDLKLSKRAKQFASNTIKTLLNAEAKVHGKKIEDIHLHETGEIDTLADIVGSTIAMEDLKIFNSKVYSTPVAVGGGLFKSSHSTLSSPAPATLEILRSKKFPFFGGPIEYELATPTGVSILSNIVGQFCRFYPMINIFNVGYGAGMKDFTEIPNVLRIVLGNPIYNMLRDEIVILETNLDDVTGELIGHVIEKLLFEGARDVSVIPTFTKKNRPGQILKVIADRENAEYLCDILIKETGSLGARMYPCERRILQREVTMINIIINGIKEEARIKMSKDAEGRVVQLKPEYEDAKRIADKTGKSLRAIVDLILVEANRRFKQ